ncbi:hypothetical protein [Candidatus Deferrimicrobium sp.]|uniref:hypothetical protein n=1 Tax=Candidatus Deferrimicrobium sp. TaxID=3060586 RepID=UPI003C44143C
MKKLVFLLFASFLIGCGGGGGGEGNPLPVYTGVRTAAPLDNTLAAGQFAFAILAPSEAGAVGPLTLSPGNNNGALVSLYSKTAVLRALRVAMPPVGTAGAPMPRSVYTDSLPGAEGGTATITVHTDVWTNNGIEFVTRIDAAFTSFDDTMDGIANPINGTMSIVPETWYGDGTPVFDEYVASFDLHVSLDPASGGRITGSLDYRQVSTTDMRHIYTWNDTLISDDQTKVQVWWNPLIETDEDIGTDRELLTITGQVYISVLGYATISPIQPFDYPTSADLKPVSGKFLLTGDLDKATITVQGTVPEVLVELDRNGDDTIDSTATHTWEELAF